MSQKSIRPPLWRSNIKQPPFILTLVKSGVISGILFLASCGGNTAPENENCESDNSCINSSQNDASSSSSNVSSSSNSSQESSNSSVASSAGSAASSSSDASSSSSSPSIPPAVVQVIYAINAGGPNYTTVNGQVFEGDGYARNAKSASTDDSISGTEDDVLYQSEAWGENLQYELPVSPGDYKITLYMAETYHEASNLRVQNISVENHQFLSSLDIFDEVGHDAAIEYESDYIEVVDGSLSLHFSGVSDAGKVSAILIESINGARTERSFEAGADSLAFEHFTDRPVHRIPGIIKTNSGRIIAGVETRETWSDHSEKEVVVIQSDDGGRSWSNQTILGDKGSSPTGNPTFVNDETANRLILFYAAYDGSEGSASNNRVYFRYSDSQGSTWSDEIEVSHLVPDDYTLALPGPGHGIQMQNKYKDRLVVPFWGYRSGRSTIFGLYSDNHGMTWHFGYQSNWDDSGAYAPNETQIIEQSNGDILVIARTARDDTEHGAGMSRAKAISTDGGESIGPLVHSSQFSGPIVMGSVISMDDRLLFSAPLHNSARENMSIRESFNSGQTWGFPKQISTGFAAYSDLVQLDNDTFGIVYEINNYKELQFKSFDINILNTQRTILEDNSPVNSETQLLSNKIDGVSAGIVNSGKFGNAIELDGDSHIAITKSAENLLGNSDFTVNLWYYSNSDFSGQESLLWFFTLGSSRDALWARLYQSYIRTLVNHGGENFFDYDTGTVADNTWHMLTIVRTGSDLSFYIDGNRKSQQSDYFVNHSFGENTDIGYLIGAKPNNKSAAGFSEGFNGKLDEIKMFKRALSQQEIDNLLSNENVSADAQILNLSFD